MIDEQAHPTHAQTLTTGLVLTGGGARAAYQVGVLKAVAQIRRECGVTNGNPFPVITGTSAGAINAAALACRADNFDEAVRALCEVWEGFHAEQVYRSDSIGVIRTGARWLTMFSLGWAIARWRRIRPRSLLDNEPLESLLQQMVHTDRLQEVMRSGHLEALAVTASSYGSGLHVTFYEAARDIVPWTRSQRIAVRGRITNAHLLASSAIPFIFPAVALDIDGHLEYCGDGSMRQSAPISPAVHLGAQRILVVGAGRMHEPPGHRAGSSDYPNLAQIAGHALSNIFLDALAVDVERLQRINSTLKLLPACGARADHLAPDRSSRDRADAAPGRPCRQAHRESAYADSSHAARLGRFRPGGAGARCGAGELPALRIGVYARAHGSWCVRHLGAACRCGSLLRLERLIRRPCQNARNDCIVLERNPPRRSRYLDYLGKSRTLCPLAGGHLA